MANIRDDIEYQKLLQLSALEGADPLRVQAAGGNTSIKQDGILWIKASGTWLQNALTSPIMVPVKLDELLQVMHQGHEDANSASLFVAQEQQDKPEIAAALRPSIETTVHAVLPQKVVVHVHCVNCIALAVRNDGETAVQQKLQDFNMAWVPYVKPGLTLSQAIQQAIDQNTDVIILGNHGLVVAADSVDEASRLLNRVCEAATQPARQAPAADTDALQTLTGNSGYKLPAFTESHAVACDKAALQIAAGGSLYPDHVIFLGQGSVVAQSGETVDDVCARHHQPDGLSPASILFPDKGVLMRGDANDGQEALARCLSDVCLRIPASASIHYLSESQNHELLNWDAEKYRQKLNQ